MSSLSMNSVILGSINNTKATIGSISTQLSTGKREQSKVLLLVLVHKLTATPPQATTSTRART
jgi:hypothetical protein